MPDTELAIFDCDGVLVDSETISNAVLAQALTAEGLSTTLIEARRGYQGMLLSEIVSEAQQRLGRPLPRTGWRDTSASASRRSTVNWSPCRMPPRPCSASAPPGYPCALRPRGRYPRPGSRSD
jgi:hypothetical protein